jgi:hypothetical protein
VYVLSEKGTILVGQTPTGICKICLGHFVHALKFTGRVQLVLKIQKPERELLDNFTLRCVHARTRETEITGSTERVIICANINIRLSLSLSLFALPLSLLSLALSLPRSLAPSLPRSLAPSISSTSRMCVCRGDMVLFEIWGSTRKTKSSLGALELPLFLRYVNDTERDFPT